ncbi:MAG: dockerin type I domain-containing protein [Fimbriimonadales bacterium]
MRWTLRKVRKAVVQKAVGKTLAVSLAVSMIIPPQLGYALSMKYGEGVNSVNSVLPISVSTTTWNLFNFSAFLPVPCPPDIPILTLPNGDATRDGKISEDDYNYIEDRLGTTNADADLNGDGKVNEEDLEIVIASTGLSSDEPWQGNFQSPSGWYRLSFAVQLGEYRGSTIGLSVQVRLRDATTGATYAQTVSLGSALQAVELQVPTGGNYAVRWWRQRGVVG